MAEQENLVTDESSDEGDTNALFCGMAEVNTSDGDSEVSTSNSLSHDSENKFFELQNEFLACKITCSEVEKKTCFFEREARLLTQEKDKLYLEKWSLVFEHISKKKSLNEKVASLDKSLKEKIKELRNNESDRLNAISLKNFFQKEREVLHQNLLDRDLLIRKYQDA
ncbi:hypothetical protein L6452_36203 [Arctium lappa]|uniref:Uncharacterized protein n=1 Tax=Arctium lappa TaxID=4217 RepID=A0ACB8Y8K2_ARCLA|nr:hypothetical protein L6452_36203 [Arctium lappa]